MSWFLTNEAAYLEKLIDSDPFQRLGLPCWAGVAGPLESIDGDEGPRDWPDDEPED
jgi:hypothetical protein